MGLLELWYNLLGEDRDVLEVNEAQSSETVA